MARITKDSASVIAKHLCSPIAKKRDEAQRAYQEAVEKEFLKNVPQIVKDTFNSHPDWFKSSSTTTMDGNGFSTEQATLTQNQPSKSDYYGGTRFTPGEKEADELIKLKNAYLDLKEEHENLVRDTENMLYSLRTTKNVAENFPEAVPFLPKDDSKTALMVPIEDLRHKLAKYPPAEE